MFYRFYASRAGFTLVELLVVIVVLGVLVGVGVAQFNPVLEKASNNIHNANVAVLKGAGQMALLAEGTPTENVIWVSIDCPEGESNYKAADYLESWPELPPHATESGENSYRVTITSSGDVEVE